MACPHLPQISVPQEKGEALQVGLSLFKEVFLFPSPRILLLLKSELVANCSHFPLKMHISPWVSLGEFFYVPWKFFSEARPGLLIGEIDSGQLGVLSRQTIPTLEQPRLSQRGESGLPAGGW